jgi:hypothetical protein
MYVVLPTPLKTNLVLLIPFLILFCHARGAMPLSIVILSIECCYAGCRIFILSVAIVAKNQLASVLFIPLTSVCMRHRLLQSADLHKIMKYINVH